MANDEHLELLRQGVKCWNAWRLKEPSVTPDLSGANLCGAVLTKANLSGANLMKANLTLANLSKSDLSGANLNLAQLNEAYLVNANLHGANLTGAWLSESNLNGADFSAADLNEVDLSDADLTRASLSGANLSRALLIKTDLRSADLTGCRVFGISSWRLRLSDGTKQRDLVITDYGEPEVTADNIEVAQFLYLMLHNEKIRNVIDTITSKVVLILGRFTPERKAVLDALRDQLRNRGYVPVVFDFDKPESQTTAETVALLARMARFVIADITDAKSVLQELRDIVPNNPMLAVQPLVIATQDEPGMFDFFSKFPWVSKTYRYKSLPQLTADLDEGILRHIEAKVLELRRP